MSSCVCQKYHIKRPSDIASCRIISEEQEKRQAYWDAAHVQTVAFASAPIDHIPAPITHIDPIPHSVAETQVTIGTEGKDGDMDIKEEGEVKLPNIEKQENDTKMEEEKQSAEVKRMGVGWDVM